MKLAAINESEFKTTDLALAAALTASGVKSIRIDKSDPRRAVFAFESNDKLFTLVNAFWEDQLRLNARTYFESIKSVKNRIYGGH